MDRFFTRRRGDESAGRAESHQRLTVLFHVRREGEDDVRSTHSSKLLSRMVFEKEDFVGAKSFCVIHFIRGVSHGDDLMSQRFDYLNREVAQSADSDNGDALSGLWP